MRFYKNKKFMEKSVYTSCALGVIVAIIRTVLLLFHFDRNANLPLNSEILTFLNIVIYGLIAIILIINLRLAMDIAPITSRFKLSMPPIAGYALFLTAILFLIQGAVDFLRDLFAFLEWYGLEEGMRLGISPITIFFPLLIDLFALMSAVAFYLVAMDHFRESEDEVKLQKTLAIPVLWGALILLELVINALNVATVQNIMEKTVLYVLVLLFVQYIAMSGFGIEPKRKSVFSVFIRIVFPIISIAFTVPYGIAYLLGIRDSGSSTPIIPIIGLSIYGFVILLQYLVASIYFFSRTKYRS